MASLESIETLLREFKKNTEEHLSKLNGKVDKNTKFRNMLIGGFVVVSVMGGTVLYKLFIG